MIRNIFISLFIALYFLNTYIAVYLVPDMNNRYNEYMEIIKLKDRIQEGMFLLIILIPFFKSSRLSKALLKGTAVLVCGSIIDKWVHGFYEYHIHDTILILGAVFITIIIWKRNI